MSRNPVSDDECALMRSLSAEHTPQEIARATGRSVRTVYNKLGQMGISPIKAPPRRASGRDVPCGEGDESRQDTLGRLRCLRDSLQRTMAEAQPGNVAAIAREYRATVEEIEQMESAESGGDDPFAALTDAIAKKLGGAMGDG